MDKEKNTKVALLQLLRKYNFKETEELFRKEANLEGVSIDDVQQPESEVTSVLSAYKSEGDPALYEKSYADLKKFVGSSLGIYKHELGTILYPVSVHSLEEAKKLIEKFSCSLEEYYQNNLKKLTYVTKREHMAGNELTDTFKSNQFIIRTSRATLCILNRYSQKKETIFCKYYSRPPLC